MLGKLIPAGTGMKRYRSVKLDSEEFTIHEDDVLDFEDDTDENAEGFAADDAETEESDSEETVTVLDTSGEEGNVPEE